MGRRRRTHKDLEFHVGRASFEPKPPDTVFRSWDKACGHALACATSNGCGYLIDVVVHSVGGARAWAGDDGEERYREDPDASVFERITVDASSLGRVR